MLFVARVVVFCKIPSTWYELDRPVAQWPDYFFLAFAFIFACIVLGLAADFTHTTQNVLNITYNFAALAISIASITVVSLPILWAFIYDGVPVVLIINSTLFAD